LLIKDVQILRTNGEQEIKTNSPNKVKIMLLAKQEPQKNVNMMYVIQETCFIAHAPLFLCFVQVQTNGVCLGSLEQSPSQ
jgi:hypothetical protein